MHSDRCGSSNARKDKMDWNLGTYFSGKKRKLIEQFEETKGLYGNSDDQSVNSRLFSNIGILVNGFTNPTAAELRILMIKYGGEFHEYPNDRVTHIIASTLAATKANHMRNKLVVKPEWILDRTLRPAILNQLEKNQNKLNDFIEKQNSKSVLDDNHVKPSTSKASASPTKDAKDENFLNKFYEKSRLHLISTLATDMKLFVNSVRHSNAPTKQIPAYVLNNEDKKVVLFENEKIFFHIDIDCFFASVSLRDKPHLQDQPVAVAHSKGEKPVNSKDDFSYSEVASCNYIAREYGLYNGMLVGEAMGLCPNLNLISYDFEQYSTCSKQIYELISQYTHQIKAVSCDEMFIDFTDLIVKSNFLLDPLNLSSFIRNEIKEQIRCPSSIGIGTNMLMARMATRKAKPNGQVWIRAGQETLDFIENMNVNNLPGVGTAIMNKLNTKWSLRTCGDLRKVNKYELQEMFGAKNGLKLYEFARGIDSRPFLENDGQLNESIECIKKSVSADVNYGIRFDTMDQVYDFFNRLSNELAERLKKYCSKGSKLTLKIRIRDPTAPIETKKYLGCGRCNEKTVSMPINTHTNDANVISECCKTLYRKHFVANVDCKDLRGIGLHMERLKSTLNNSPKKNTLNFTSSKKTVNVDKSSQLTSRPVEIVFIEDSNPPSEPLFRNENKELDYLEEFEKFKQKLEAQKNKTMCVTVDDDVDLTAIKIVLNDWICWSSNLMSNKKVDEDDIEIFKGYLFYVMNKLQDFDRLLTIMKLFKRLIIVNGCHKWIRVYKQISSEVQTEFYLKHNSVLQFDD